MSNRTLMEAGVWLVPPEERPPGWEKLNVGEAAASIVAPPPQEAHVAPTEADVAAAVGRVAEDTAAAAPSPSVSQKALWRTLKKAVQQSGEVAGSSADLIEAGMILCAGMWSCDFTVIAHMVGCSRRAVQRRAQILIPLRMWNRAGGHYTAELGAFKSKRYGDLEFWLRAMIANGDLVGSRRAEDGELMFAAKKAANG